MAKNQSTRFLSIQLLPTASDLLPLLILALAVFTRLLPGPRTIDDAYITFRYARNLLSGEGFVYNPGEHVLGTTTPLYTMLMVFTGSLSGGANAPFPQIAAAINAAADGLVCLILIQLGKRLGFRLAGWGAALAWAVAPFSVTFAIGGLETSVYVLLLTGTVLAHVEERRKTAALLAGLSLLTRPDALILVGPLALDRGWQIFQTARKGKLALQPIVGELLAFGLLPAIWIVFASLYFGSPLPHSIAAKGLAYHLSPLEGIIRLLQHYGTPFMDDLTFGTSWIGVGLVVYLFLFLLGARRALGTSPHAWPFAVYPWLYLAVFAAANPLIFRWYLTPPLPAYFLFIFGGAETLVFDIAAAIRTRRHAGLVSMPSDSAAGKQPALQFEKIIALMLVTIIPTLLLLRGWQIHPDHGLDRPAPDMAWYKLELLYHQAAQSLLPELAQPSPGHLPLLAAGDVGVLGYETGTRILDTVGLNSPESSLYYPLDPAFYAINYAIPPRLILDRLPDYIVILEVYGRQGLLKDPAFWQTYRLQEKIPTDIYGSDGMLILERKQP